MAGPWFQWHRAAAVYFGEQTVKAGSAVSAVKAVTGSLPLFLLVSSSSQDGSGTNKAEVRAVMEQWDHRCMCASARIMLGREDRNTMEDGLAGPRVGLGSQSSWKTLVQGSPCWRTPTPIWGHLYFRAGCEVASPKNLAMGFTATQLRSLSSGPWQRAVASDGCGPWDQRRERSPMGQTGAALSLHC